MAWISTAGSLEPWGRPRYPAAAAYATLALDRQGARARPLSLTLYNFDFVTVNQHE